MVSIRFKNIWKRIFFWYFVIISSKFEFAGLKSHPQYELAKRQMRGFSGMVTFYIKGGLEESRVFLKALKVNNGHLCPPITNTSARN